MLSPVCCAGYIQKHYLIQCQCLESIVNDFCNGQGVVSGRAAAILRSTEAYPLLDDSIILYICTFINANVKRRYNLLLKL